jgi:hypothetical protein
MIPTITRRVARSMRLTIAQPRRCLPALAATFVVGLGATASAQPSPATPADAFASRGWHLELTGHGALETWNYNISHEELYGVTAGMTYGVGNGIVLIARSPLYYVSQRGVDAFTLGATFGIRGRVYRRQRLSIFLEFEVGLSESDTHVPPRGTRFNYLALGSAGATIRVRHGVHLIAGLKWIHVSNNGLAGRDRNPDIEAVGPTVGVLLGF